jgi:hypothetical protein
MPQPKPDRKLFGGGARRRGDTLAARVVVVLVFLGFVVLGAISPEFLQALRLIICPQSPLTMLA